MYFHFSDDDVKFDGKLESMQCEAVKVNGNRCNNKTVVGHNFCHVHRKHMLHLQIKDSTIPNANQGLFAYGKQGEVVFKKGQRICLYNGEVIDNDELLERYGLNTAPYGIKLHNKDGEPQYEDAAISRGVGALVNHTRNNSKINAKLSINRENRAQIMAIKNIKAGQEIFVNYGNGYKFNEGISCTNRSKHKC